MGFLIGHTGIRFTGNYQCQERFKTIGTESSLNWFVYFCSCSKVRKTCWLWQFLTTWDGSCFNIDSHETGWLEYEMWPKLLWIWYRTCETCDMLLIHCIRRLLFLLGSGRTQSVRQKTIVFPSRKNFLLFSCFPPFFSAFVGAVVVVVVPFFTFWPTLGWRHGAFGNFRCRGARGEPQWIETIIPILRRGRRILMDSPF